jgi:squalene-associated FAD-dependent desaturase
VAAVVVAKYDAAVVGAGCAGLSAAVRLAKHGARVLVLEARGRLGGRATAFDDRDTGERVDNGQHILLGCYRHTFEFLDDVGAGHRVRLDPHLRVAMIDRAGTFSRLECPSLPSPFHLIAGVFGWSAIGWRDRLSILRMAAPIKQGPKSTAPGETVDQWLIRHGQTARVREMLWGPLALAALNQSPARAGAATFARVLTEMFSGDPRASALAVPLVPLDEMYAEPARSYIEHHGGRVQMGSRATIRVDGLAVNGVAAGPDRWEVPAVVSAAPWFAVDGMFEGQASALEPILARARAMESCPIVTVNLWFDRPVIEDTFVGLPGRSMQWVFDKRAAFGERAAHLSVVSSDADALVALANSDLVRLAHDEILQAIPAARAATLSRATVIREPRATFSLAPGQPRRPGTETPVRGSSWLAIGSIPGCPLRSKAQY